MSATNPLQVLTAICRSALGVLLTLLLGTGLAWSAAPFVDNNDGTVTDTSTGLMWDQCSLGQTQGINACSGTALTYTWEAAHAQVGTVQKSGNYKGFSDWRLPSSVELFSLVKTGPTPSIDSTVFPGTYLIGYWASTSYANSPNLAWYVHFVNGYYGSYDKSHSFDVRLVRGGQSFGSFGVSQAGLSGISQTGATLTATSAIAATGYWLVVPRGAASPLPAEIMAQAASYRGVTVAAHGQASMTAATPKAFAISGLDAGVNYDLYLLAKDISYQTTSAVTGPLEFATQGFIVMPILRQLTVTGAGTGAGLVRASGGMNCVRAGGGDMGTCSVSYDTSSVTLTATAAPGSSFGGWSGGGCSGSAATCTVSLISSDQTVTASFANPVAVSQIVLDPITPGTLYSSLDGGGVYKKTASADWAAINTGLGNLSVKALTIKLDASRLFAGTDGGGVFYGDGSSWAACPNTDSGMSNLHVRSLTVSGSTLYAGTTGGVFVSTDDCTTWVAMNAGLP